MARWKLMTPHYLHLVDKTEWEYKETTRDGKQKRMTVQVPRFLHPHDPGDWNNTWGHGQSLEGEIIVCTPGTGASRDYEFLGDPTPDMMPLDDEAAAISAKFTERWSYKPDGETSYSQSMIDKFQLEQAAAVSKPQQMEIAGLDKLLESVTALVQHSASAPAASPRRA